MEDPVKEGSHHLMDGVEAVMRTLVPLKRHMWVPRSMRRMTKKEALSLGP